MGITKVLFPVDLAGSSYRIVPKVRAFADKYDAELHLVYVTETLEGYSTFFIPHRSLDLMEMEDNALARRHLEEFAERYFEDRPKVRIEVLRGKPVDEVRKYIESENMDIVIVATHIKDVLERVIFGDIAEKIARTSPVPVMIVNAFEEAAPVPVGTDLPGVVHHGERT